MFKRLNQLNIYLTVLILSIIHFVATIIFFIVSFDLAMLEKADYMEPLSVTIATFLFKILIQPYFTIHTLLKNNFQLIIPGSLEWIFMIANSLLWGFIIAYLIRLKRYLSPNPSA